MSTTPYLVVDTYPQPCLYTATTYEQEKPVTETPESTRAPETAVATFKGFGLDWKCRGHQYEVGGVYIHEGRVKACDSGFHACEYPLDVFGYYPPGTSRYATTTQSGEIHRREHGDTKIASAKITVGVEISVSEMVVAAVKWIGTRCTPDNSNHATGDQSAASATGYRSAASATGYRSAAMASGRAGRVMGLDGRALFLVYRDPDTYEITQAWAGIVGRNGVKAETWYVLGADGAPVECAAE